MFNFFNSNKKKLEQQKQEYDKAILELQTKMQAKVNGAQTLTNKSMMLGASGSYVSLGGSGGASGGGRGTITTGPGTVMLSSDGTTLHRIGKGQCEKCGYENDLQNTHCHLCNDELHFKEIIMNQGTRLTVDSNGRGWYGSAGTSV